MNRWTVVLSVLVVALHMSASPVLPQHVGRHRASSSHGKAGESAAGKGGTGTASGEAMTKILSRPDSKLVAKLQAMLPPRYEHPGSGEELQEPLRSSLPYNVF